MGGSSERLRVAEKRLAADPSEPETLASLEHLLETPERLDAARLLASAHERAGNDQALIRALEVLGDTVGDAAEQVASLKRIARIQRLKLRQPDLALATLMKAVDLRPEDAELHRFAKEAAVEADAVEVLEELLDDLLDRVEGKARDAVLEAIRRLNQPDEPGGPTANDLLSALQAFVTPGTDRLKALPGLRSLAQQVDALDSLAEVVEGESEKIEEPAELAALLRFVALLREELKQPRQAAVAWNDLLAVQPDDLEALEHLRALLTATGDSKGAAEVTLRRARLPGVDRTALLVEAADLFVAAEDPDAAARALEEALAAGPDPRIQLRRGKLVEREHPTHAVEAYTQALAAPGLEAEAAAGLERLLSVPAARAAAGAVLEPYLRPLGDPRRLVEALEAQTDAPDLPARRMRFVEIARLWEQAKEPRAALGAQLRAFHEAPAHERTRVDLELLAKSLDAKDELLAAYEEALDRDPRGAAVLWRRVAELRQELGEGGKALEAWERAAEAAPRDTDLLTAYATACRAQGDQPRLARVLRSLVDALPSSPARTELLYELADLCADDLGDPAGAVRAYQELRSQAPDDRAVLKSLQRLYEKAGDAAGLEEALARDLELARQAGSEEVGALALRLGLLRLGRPGKEAGALQLLSEVLRLEPDNGEALAAVGKLASAPGPLQQQAAQLVTPALDKLGDRQVGAQILEAQLAAQVDPAERAATLHRLADLHEGQLDDPDMAFLAITRALREQPQDEGLLRRCVALAEVTGAQEDLEALLEELARAQPPGPAKVELWRARARSLQERSQVVDAVRAWTEVRALSPADPEATERLASVLEKGGRLKDLADLIQQQAEASAPEQRPAAFARLAAAREKAGQLDEAVAVLHGLYAMTQGQDALRSLERLLGKLDRHQERAEVLKRLATASGGETERADLLLQQAKAQQQAGEPAGAASTLAELLAKSPDEPRAIAELVALANDPKARATALKLLESAFKDPKQGWQRVSVLELLVEARGPEEGRALRAELAALHETLGDLRQAFAWRLRLLAEDPGDPGARVEAERLAQVAQMEEELEGAYEDLLERQPVDLRLGAAGREQPVLERVLERTGRFEQLAELLQLRPDDLGALARLDQVYGQLEKWPELVDVLERRIRLEPARRIELQLRLAQLRQERLDDPAGAVPLLAEVLQWDPGHLDAARALEALYERLGQQDRLLELLEHLLAYGPAEQKTSIRFKLAKLRAGAEPARAEALCRQVLAADPLQVEAFDLLAALLEKGRRHQELEQLLLARLAVTLAPAAVADLEYRLAELEYRRLQRPESATARYRLVLERIPRHEGALAALAEIYESSASWRDLSRVLGELAQVRTDPVRRRIDHLRHAEALVRLGALPPALAAAQQALDLAPDNEAELRRLRELFEAQGALAEVAKVLGLTADLHLRAGRTDAAVGVLFELAGVEPDRGGVALEAILTHQPSNRAAYDRARALYEGAGSWSALAALIARFLPNLEGEERLAALDALADLDESKLGDPLEAFGWAKQAVLLDPGSGPRRQRLERLARSLQRADELADTYRQILREPGREPVLDTVALALAAVEDEVLEQTDRAEETLRGVLERDPGNAAATAQLVELFARHGQDQKSAEALERQLASTEDPAARVQVLRQLSELRRRRRQWPEALGALQQIADLVTGPQARAQALLEIAQLQEQELADPESAVATLLAALEQDPAALEPFSALERIYRRLDRPAELLRAIEARLAHAGAGEQVELLFKSAELWDQQGDLAQADRCLESVLQLRPDEVRAMEELARLRRTGGRWEPLVEILTRHAAVAEQPEVRAALCTELGELHLLHLQDAKGAERWWRKAVEQLPTHRPALRALGELDQREGRWAHAAEMLEREARLEEDAATRADLFHRAAVIREEQLRDLVNARKTYDLALKSDELHWPSIRRLRALASQAKAWPEYEESLALEARRAPSAAERGAAAIELGAHFAQRILDSARAIDWYRHALEQQPGALEATLPLADLLVGAGQWAPAAEVLEAAIPALEEDGERVRRLCQLGLAQQQLQRTAAAIDTYGRALALEPDDAAALRGRFHLLDATGRREEAAEALQRLLAVHERDLPEADRVALGVRLGELYRALGRPAEAQVAAERALALAPGHPGALHLLVAVCDQLSAFDKSIRYRQLLAAAVAPDERYQLLVELAGIAHQKIGDLKRSIEGYLQALQVRPDSLEVLQRLHVVYREAGQERKAVETLQAVLAHPGLPRAEWRRETLALAELIGRQPSGLEGAVELLEKAFDRDPAFGEAIPAVETLLGRARQWRRLDASYERVAQSLSKAKDTAPAQAALWLAAGQLRLKELKDRPAALAAFATRARLLPDDAEALETFGDLAMEFPAHGRDALAAYLRALPATAHPEKLCSAAAQLAERSGDADTAYLASRAAQLLGKPTAAQEALLARLGPLVQSPPELRVPVSEESWTKHLLHPAVRGPLGELLALLFQWVGAEYGADLDDFKLHPKKHAVDLAAATHPALRHLVATASALGHPSLKLFSPFLAPQPSGRRTPHPDDAAGLRAVPTVPLSLVVGERFLTAADRATQSAWIGHAVAHLRPEVAMPLVLGPERLPLVIETALSLGYEGHVSRVDPKVLKVERKRLEKAMSSAPRDALSNAVRAYARTALPDDLARYLDGARLTPLRAAVLAAGEFEPVRALFSPGDAALRDLVGFALGGDLQALRQQTQSRLITRR